MLMAIFRDWGSAIATLCGGKAANVYGRLPGDAIERVDAEHGPRSRWHARHSNLDALFPKENRLDWGHLHTCDDLCVAC